MLNELSCWYFDWSTVGTWVGGLATAGATGFGVHAANKAWKAEHDRRQTKLHVLQVQITPEMARAHGVISTIRTDAKQPFFDSHARVAYAINGLDQTYIHKLLEAPGDIDEELAIAAAQFQVFRDLLRDALVGWNKGNRAEGGREQIVKTAELLQARLKNLAAEMARAIPANRDAVQSILDEGR